ncbi:MAG TPA: DUF2254 domain-containing protein [Pirellulales bacterium]
MSTFLRKHWEHLRSSFWFLPSLMTLAAVVLASLTVAIDGTLATPWDWAYDGGAEGASAVLGAIAGSMITIAGIVFSLTSVTLSLASSQFGPRLLRNFMRDATNQFVLGTFVATFLYCLLVLRTIRQGDDGTFVPHLSVSIGVLFAVASIGVLIYFIHHVSVSIQANEIIARVGGELNQAIDRLYPAPTSQPEADETRGLQSDEWERPDESQVDALPVGAAQDGYLQIIDIDALAALAGHQNAFVKVERRPGQYVVQGTLLARVFQEETSEEPVPDDQRRKQLESIAAGVRSAFVVGPQRTDSQDLKFLIEELVEVASRALSPGVNDPYTAIACIDRLGSALHRLARRPMRAELRRDKSGRLLAAVPPLEYDDVVDTAFNAIRQYGRASPAVLIRLLETIAVAASAAERPEQLAALRRQADMIARSVREAIYEEEDQTTVAEFHHRALRAIETASAAASPR